jgi:hypothetical protein
MSRGIRPDEALRELIKAHDPALAEQVKSLDDIRRLQDLGLAKAKDRGKVLARANILKSCWEQLYNDVRANRIRLRGTLDPSKPPIDIDEAEQEIGKLDIWNATLTCAPERVYKDVRCKEVPPLSEAMPTTASVPAKLARAMEAVNAVFPDGVPSQADMLNSLLCSKLDDWHKVDLENRELQFYSISNDTFLRAANRKQQANGRK